MKSPLHTKAQRQSSPQQKSQSTSKSKLINTLPSLFTLSLLGLWELGVRLSHIPPYILPAPTAILVKLAEPQIAQLLLYHSSVSLLSTLLGLLLALLTALLLSYLMQRYPILYRVFSPLLVVSQTVPSLVLAPILLVLLGFGLTSKVVVVLLFCFFPITTGFSNALRSIDPDYLILMRSLHASFHQCFFKVQVRLALPGFFGGLKIAATYSVSGAVTAEFFGAQAGLGIFMHNAFASSRTELLFLVALIISLLSIGLVQICQFFENKFCQHQIKG